MKHETCFFTGNVYCAVNWVEHIVLGIFPKETSQMFNFPNGNFPKLRLGLLRRRELRLQW